jgi:site-specific DNA-methyltransferase (adenine-specific)
MWLHGQGFPKGKTQLKPAWEPICLAYKPGGKRSLQIDECRIPTGDGTEPRNRWDGQASAERRYTEKGSTNFAAKPGRRIGRPLRVGDYKETNSSVYSGQAVGGTTLGRWPANVCHDGSDSVMAVFATFNAPGQQYAVRGTEPSRRLGANGIYFQAGSDRSEHQPVGDEGSPARFYYCAKADAEDRWGSKHPTVKPVELLKWLVPLFTPKGGLVIDAFAGSGTMGIAAMATGRDCILIEREADYIADIRERLAFYEGHERHSLVSKNRNRREVRGTLL